MTETAKRPLYVPHAGPSLLEMPLLNKGSAFSTQERIDFNLQGLLPHNIETIEEQTERAYSQYNLCNTDLDRHISCARSRTTTRPCSSACSRSTWKK